MGGGLAMQKIKNRIIKIIIFFIVIAIAANISISLFFYHLAVARTNKEFLADSPSLKSAKSADSSESVAASAKAMTFSAESDQIDWFSESTYEQVNITSDDGLILNGYFRKAITPTNKTVILAHGYSSQGTYMGPYARLYSEDFGYNVLLPDSRGHGKSEGSFIGFGWVDRLDYEKWIDFIIHKIGQNSEIVLHGVSMGGATVLMTSGENLPDNVKAVVSDCAYTSVSDELGYQLKTMVNLPYFPLLSSTSILSKIRAGYFFEEASALKQVRKSNLPTLFIHGSADDFVPFYMVKELYNACKSEKELLVVPDAGHGMAYDTDPDTYRQTVGDFIQKYVK